MNKLIPSASQGGAFLLGLLSSLSDLLLLGTSAYIISSAALQPPLYMLTLSITLVRACGISRAVFRYLERYVSHTAAFKFSEKINVEFYNYAAKVLPLRGTSIAHDEGSFIQRLNREAVIWRNVYLRGFTIPTINLLLSLLAMVILLPYAGAGCLVIAFCWAAGLTIPFFFENRKEQLAGQYAAYRKMILDFKKGRDEIVNSGQDAYFTAKLNQQAQKIAEINEKQGILSLLSSYGVNIICVAAFIILLLLLVQSLFKGLLTGIELAVLAICTQALLIELAGMHDSVQALMEAWKSREVLKNRLEGEGAHKDSRVTNSMGVTDEVPLIQVDNISFSYDGKNQILKDFSLSIRKGDKLAIVGDSGTGKTTLFYLLLSMWQADAGIILYRGQPYGEHVLSDISAATQGNYIFNLSLRENFQRLHPAVSDAEIMKAMEVAEFSSVLEKLPDGLDTVVGENASRLSGGQRQRLMVSLALASKAEIILLDEPTCGVDKVTALKMIDNILSANSGKTIIIITHEDFVAQRLNKIYRVGQS